MLHLTQAVAGLLSLSVKPSRDETTFRCKNNEPGGQTSSAQDLVGSETNDPGGHCHSVRKIYHNELQTVSQGVAEFMSASTACL
jgi:hypothetical protein